LGIKLSGESLNDTLHDGKRRPLSLGRSDTVGAAERTANVVARGTETRRNPKQLRATTRLHGRMPKIARSGAKPV